jgi:hypothetical protein
MQIGLDQKSFQKSVALKDSLTTSPSSQNPPSPRPSHIPSSPRPSLLSKCINYRF